MTTGYDTGDTMTAGLGDRLTRIWGIPSVSRTGRPQRYDRRRNVGAPFNLADSCHVALATPQAASTELTDMRTGALPDGRA